MQVGIPRHTGTFALPVGLAVFVEQLVALLCKAAELVVDLVVTDHNLGRMQGPQRHLKQLARLGCPVILSQGG